MTGMVLSVKTSGTGASTRMNHPCCLLKNIVFVSMIAALLFVSHNEYPANKNLTENRIGSTYDFRGDDHGDRWQYYDNPRRMESRERRYVRKGYYSSRRSDDYGSHYRRRRPLPRSYYYRDDLPPRQYIPTSIYSRRRRRQQLMRSNRGQRFQIAAGEANARNRGGANLEKALENLRAQLDTYRNTNVTPNEVLSSALEAMNEKVEWFRKKLIADHNGTDIIQIIANETQRVVEYNQRVTLPEEKESNEEDGRDAEMQVENRLKFKSTPTTEVAAASSALLTTSQVRSIPLPSIKEVENEQEDNDNEEDMDMTTPPAPKE
mmetsp:Transcript_10052/g.16232  ORF Transcript_10052/g.16232 Transcript_10052/m.16232 type:complete len:320 (-) Transcript_10052:89-1048(-)